MGSISAALRQQYRMPAQLMAFPSAAFYGAELVARHRAPESVVSESKEMVTLKFPVFLVYFVIRMFDSFVHPKVQ